jgi:HK97 family phage major capsid protein
MRLLDLRERRASVVDEMRSLLSSELNDEGRTRFETLKAENERLEQDITRAEYLAEAEWRMAADPRDLAGDGTFERECRSFSLLRVIASQVPGIRVDAGRELEISAELQRRSGRAHEGITVPSTVFETRVLTTAAPAGGPGSNIIATDHRADQYIDILRARLVTRRLGATVLSGLTGNVAIPRRKASNAAYWVAENAAVTASDPQFEQVTLAPKHVGCLVEFSRNLLLQSSPDVEQLVRQDFAAVLAEGIDRVAIKGGGTSEPTGILGTSDIGSFSLATVSWANVLEAISDVEVANADGPFAWLTHPACGQDAAEHREGDRRHDRQLHHAGTRQPCWLRLHGLDAGSDQSRRWDRQEGAHFRQLVAALARALERIRRSGQPVRDDGLQQGQRAGARHGYL